MCSPPSAPSPSISGGLALLLVAAAALVSAQPATVAEATPIDVSHYTVALDLDVDHGTITGTERVELTLRAPGTVIALDSGALAVDSVQSGGAPLSFTQSAQRLSTAGTVSSTFILARSACQAALSARSSRSASRRWRLRA